MLELERRSITRTKSSIPNIDANNFKIKSDVTQMVEQMVLFDGYQDMRPNTYITSFLEICDTFKINGTLDDAVILWLLLFH